MSARVPLQPLQPHDAGGVAFFIGVMQNEGNITPWRKPDPKHL